MPVVAPTVAYRPYLRVFAGRRLSAGGCQGYPVTTYRPFLGTYETRWCRIRRTARTIRSRRRLRSASPILPRILIALR